MSKFLRSRFFVICVCVMLVLVLVPSAFVALGQTDLLRSALVTVTKPFSVKELLSRIRANIRRGRNEMVIAPEHHSTNSIMIGDLLIDCEHYSVTKSGAPIELSKKEYDLLVFLALHAGQAFSREALLEEVWGYAGFYGDIRTVDVTISRLRDKLSDDKSNLKYILTKRNVGYYLNNFS